MNLTPADLTAAGRVADWVRSNPAQLATEVAEMATYFPTWLLTVSNGTDLTSCKQCDELLLFAEGKLRCRSCGRAGKGPRLAWTGHLPLPVDGLPHALARILAHPHPAYPLITVGGTRLWLIPVVAHYPVDWPRSQPTIQYDPELFRILGIASPNASHHMIGSTLCLYASGQWRTVTLRVVLQQRVVNHLASILKVGNGQEPVAAFAGKQHIYGSRDEWDYR